MANEYMVNASDILSIANAIREKGGTTEGLAFPDGFVSSIQAIQSGSSLNFTVVGDTTQPENPVENTIWVNTSTTITEYGFGNNLCSTPIEGMVWILNGTKIDTEIEISEDPSLTVSPVSAWQYISGSWVKQPSYVYVNGQWKTAGTQFLFANGDQYTNVTGGWSKSGWSVSGISWHASDWNNCAVGTTLRTSIYIPDDANVGGVLGTANKIPLSNYKKMRVRGTSTRSSAITHMIGLSSGKTATTSPIACLKYCGGSDGEFEGVLNLPDGVDSAYVFLLSYLSSDTQERTTFNMYISEIILE